MHGTYGIDDPWQIPLEVRAKRQKVGHNNHVTDTSLKEAGDGARQIGRSQFQKCRFYMREAAGARQSRRDHLHSLVSLWYARAVREHY